MGYLIYSASSFKLLSGMIKGTVVTEFGSDLYIRSTGDANIANYASVKTPLDEEAITTFIEQQPEGTVAAYGYQSVSLPVYETTLYPGGSTAISDYSGWRYYGLNYYAVPENYMSYIDLEYYFPSQNQPGIKLNKTHGVDDPV